MARVDIFEIAKQLAGEQQRWQEVLRSEHLSVGVYRLRAGEPDPQQPHLEDEVYYVIEGRAVLRVEESIHKVAPGVAVYVPAHVDHKFERIEEDLLLLVFFAPPETSAS